MMPLIDNTGNEYAQDTDGVLSVNNFSMEEGGMTIAAAVNGVQDGSWGWSGGSGWTEDLDFAGSSIRMTVAHSTYRYSASGSDSVTATYTPGTLNDQVLVVASLRPASTGIVVAWVRIPSLAKDTDTQIYMYYGNSCIANQTENPQGVWDSNFKGVWHLVEDPSATGPQAKDSTQFGNHGTSYGSMTASDQVTGRIGGSWHFDGLATVGDGDYIDQGTNTSLNMGAGDYTLETWFKTSTKTEDMYLAGKGMSGTGGKRYMLVIRANCSNGHTKTTVDDDTAADESICSTSPYDDGVWHHAVAVRDGNNLRLYMDGVEDPASPADITTLGNIDDARPFTSAIFYNEGALNYDGTLEGQLDEIRISSTARSADWIATEYNNQGSPTTFLSAGAEGGGPPTAIGLISFTASGAGNDVKVAWHTGHEIANLGFNVYRSTNKGGPYRVARIRRSIRL
jgi:hypothetical protein